METDAVASEPREPAQDAPDPPTVVGDVDVRRLEDLERELAGLEGALAALDDALDGAADDAADPGAPDDGSAR